jgi:hypothetical protein
MQNAEQSMRLSSAQLRLFVAIMLQNQSIFDVVKARLTVDHFNEESYRFLYRVILDYYEVNKCLPLYPELAVELETLLEEDGDLLSEEDREELEEFLAYAYDEETFTGCPVDSIKSEKFAVKVFKKLLARKLHQFVTVEINNASVDDLPIFAQRFTQELEEIKYVNATSEVTMSFPTGWDKENPRSIVTTGLSFLDKYMGGGAAPGEGYGLMAPYGTCKTTLGVMLWATTAMKCYADWLADESAEDKKKIGLSVLVTYEASRTPEILHRTAMYAATIRRSSLDRMGLDGLDALGNDSTKPLDYEQTKFKDQINHGVFIPERKRIENIIPILNKHSVCFDFSGADKAFPTAGSGGVNEIITRLKLELKARGQNHYIKNIIIDYLGIMVDRDSSQKDKNKSKEDHKVYQVAAQEIVTSICKPFNCHSWILHQLSGSANSMLSPTKTLHHTDAKGSKSFAENLDFCFVIGNLNNDAMGQIACTKARRFRKLPASVIQVDGEFNTVRGLDNYYIDDKGGIIDKSTMTIAGAIADVALDVSASSEPAAEIAFGT